MSFTIASLQPLAQGLTGAPVGNIDAIDWVNEALSNLDPDTYPEKRFGMYGIKANAQYGLPANFVKVLELKTITNLLTANQSSVETDTAGLTVDADTVNYTLSRDTTWSTHGIASAKLISSESGTQDMAIKTTTTIAAVSADTYYCLGVRAKSTASAKSWRVGIVWLDENDAEIATVYGDSSTAQASDTWVYALAVSPPEAAGAYVLLQLLECANTEAIWWDGAMLFAVGEEGGSGTYDRWSYRVRKEKLSLNADDDAELRYLAYPAPITAVGDAVDLHDAFKWPLVKMLAARQQSRDGDVPDADQKWRAEFAADVARVLNRLDLEEPMLERHQLRW